MVDCGGTSICRCRLRLRRIKTVVMSSTRTKPPKTPPEIAPTGGPLWSSFTSFVAGFVLAGFVAVGVVSVGVVSVGVVVIEGSKTWASFGSWNPLDGSVVVAYPVALHGHLSVIIIKGELE